MYAVIYLLQKIYQYLNSIDFILNRYKDSWGKYNQS